MADFTSSLYLGMLHPSSALGPWTQLTTGAPSALRSPPGAVRLATELARLQDCERATLRRSTLHAFWDFFGGLDAKTATVVVDRGSYPSLRWGAERARGRGVPTSTFAHHDPADLARRLDQAPASRSPVVVTDGFCPGCGQSAPLRAYRDLTRERGGLLVLDDTQALGVLGRRSEGLAGTGYGCGGGGSVPWAGIAGPDVLVVSSLAKALGAPLAAVAGSASAVERLRAVSRSDTTVYSSPPTAADLGAARTALDENRRRGDALRSRLFALVTRLRRNLRALGIALVGGSFPVQSFALSDADRAVDVHRHLLARGVRAVLTRPRCRTGVDITFLVTTRHRPEDVDGAADAMAHALRGRTHAAAR